MYLNKTVTVYFCCRNEGSHLLEVVKQVPDFVNEILIINNKSTDNTDEIAASITATNKKVKYFVDNREEGGIGYGYANITAINNATSDIIVSCDGDLTYPIDKLPSILDYHIANNIDFLSCNRYPVTKETNIPLMLKIGVNILNIEVRLLYNKNIKDILSGMWVINSNIRHQLDLTAGDWNLSPQIKISAATNPNIKFSEFKISQYERAGHSKQNYFKTGYSHFSWIFLNTNKFVNKSKAISFELA